jgi:putative hydroxymethylpyrimidine transport system substrate-binding protein
MPKKLRPIRLGLEWFLNPDHLPFLVGLEKKWFEAEGIKLELIEPKEHLDAIDEIEAGKMDVAITEPIHLVSDVSKGHKAVGFARFLHTNGGVMYFNESGTQRPKITRPKDMAGKRVQYPGAPGKGGLAIVQTMIEHDGGKSNAPLTPVNNGFFHTNALAENKADLATLIFYNFEIIEARERGFNADFFALKDWGVPDFCQLILISSRKTLKEKETDIESLVRVMRRGIDFIHQSPDEARSIYMKRTKSNPTDTMTASIFNATVPCFTFDFSMTKEYYKTLAKWMKKTGQIKHTPSPKDCWTNALA